MSVVSRQGFKYSIIGYFGFLIGTLSAIFIYPFNLEFYGTIRYVLSTSELLFPFILVGISHSNVRFYFELSQKNKQHHLLSFSFLFTLFFGIIFIFLVEMIGFYFAEFRKMEIWIYRFYIYVLMFILAFSQLISRYLTNLKRIAISGLIENLVPKLSVLAAFVAFVFFSINQNYSLNIFLIVFFTSFISLWIYLKHLDSFKFKTNYSFLKENNFYKPLLSFGLFGLLGSLGSYVALRIDIAFIGEFIGKKSNGIFATLQSLLSILSIPTMGVYAISSPIIREYLIKNDFKELRNFYQKSSFILFLIGTLLFCMMISGIDSLFLIMKNGNELIPYISIIYILGFAILFDLATGFNSHIITMSKHYRFNVYFMLILAILTIVLNVVFIKYFSMGIIGVSIATALSLTIYNLIKLVFNWNKFKIHPFTFKMVLIFCLLIFSLVINNFLPRFNQEFLNLIFRPILILILFIIANQVFKFVPLNKLSPKNWKSFLTGK